mmetsp:Transcript_23637/g.55834  ORF Transcript_23637/g.55834 Transcript_23637/m.55834 type:complete len:183 (+) Transcript_23637:78-626(+)
MLSRMMRSEGGLSCLIVFGCLLVPSWTAALSSAGNAAARSGSRRDTFQCSSSAHCPEIGSLSWGKIVLKDPATGLSATFRDAKIWPGGARPWDWRETGTHHSPGTQIEDIQELLAADPDVVIISRGMQEALGVSPELRQAMSASRERSTVAWLELRSDLVADRYRELSRSGLRVAALVHTTC